MHSIHCGKLVLLQTLHNLTYVITYIYVGNLFKITLLYEILMQWIRIYA